MHEEKVLSLNSQYLGKCKSKLQQGIISPQLNGHQQKDNK
jgi:hypothetical protein